MANKNKKTDNIDYEAIFQDCTNDFTDKNTFLLLQILAELKKINGEELPRY
jgi:hypothetical protein